MLTDKKWMNERWKSSTPFSNYSYTHTNVVQRIFCFRCVFDRKINNWLTHTFLLNFPWKQNAIFMNKVVNVTILICGNTTSR